AASGGVFLQRPPNRRLRFTRLEEPVTVRLTVIEVRQPHRKDLFGTVVEPLPKDPHALSAPRHRQLDRPTLAQLYDVPLGSDGPTTMLWDDYEERRFDRSAVVDDDRDGPSREEGPLRGTVRSFQARFASMRQTAG